MKYKVTFSDDAIHNLKKDDKSIRVVIKWINKNLLKTDNPFGKGKALKGEYKGFCRYRVGDYRIIANVSENKVNI